MIFLSYLSEGQNDNKTETLWFSKNKSFKLFFWVFPQIAIANPNLNWDLWTNHGRRWSCKWTRLAFTFNFIGDHRNRITNRHLYALRRIIQLREKDVGDGLIAICAQTRHTRRTLWTGIARRSMNRHASSRRTDFGHYLDKIFQKWQSNFIPRSSHYTTLDLSGGM